MKTWASESLDRCWIGVAVEGWTRESGHRLVHRLARQRSASKKVRRGEDASIIEPTARITVSKTQNPPPNPSKELRAVRAGRERTTFLCVRMH
jgi:hypothetical protein